MISTMAGVPVMPAPTDRRRRRTVAAILDAAERLFAERGYQAATVEAIAREADVAIGSIYFNFEGGKRDVYLALAERYVAINEQELSAAREGAPDALAELAAIADAYARFHLDHPLALRLIGLRDVDGAADERLVAVRKEIARRLRAMMQETAAVVARAREEGGASAGIDPEATAAFLWGAWNGVIALHARGLLSRRQLAAALDTGRTLLLEGVSGGRSP